MFESFESLKERESELTLEIVVFIDELHDEEQLIFVLDKQCVDSKIVTQYVSNI